LVDSESKWLCGSGHCTIGNLGGEVKGAEYCWGARDNTSGGEIRLGDDARIDTRGGSALGLRRSILHATEAGRPVYAAMGYRDVARFALLSTTPPEQHCHQAMLAMFQLSVA